MQPEQLFGIVTDLDIRPMSDNKMYKVKVEIMVPMDTEITTDFMKKTIQQEMDEYGDYTIASVMHVVDVASEQKRHISNFQNLEDPAFFKNMETEMRYVIALGVVKQKESNLAGMPWEEFSKLLG
jgi:hypothetical protein